MRLLGPCLTAGLLALAGTAHAAPLPGLLPALQVPSCAPDAAACQPAMRVLYRRM